MSWRDALLLVCLLAVAACDPGAPESESESGSGSGSEFQQVVVPLLNRHCVMCHMADGAQGDFSLHPHPHASLVGAPSTQSELMLVVAGDVEGSYLYHKLVGSHLSVGGTGASMPYQRELLDEADIDVIAQWIAQGAGNK